MWILRVFKRKIQQGGREKQKAAYSGCAGARRASPRLSTEHSVMFSPPLFKHPKWRNFCSFFGEVVPGLTVASWPNPGVPEMGLASLFCSLSPCFSTAESLGLAGEDSPPSAGEGGCLVTCPDYTYFRLLIFLRKSVLAAPSSHSQTSLTPPICLR